MILISHVNFQEAPLRSSDLRVSQESEEVKKDAEAWHLGVATLSTSVGFVGFLLLVLKNHDPKQPGGNVQNVVQRIWEQR